MAYEHISHNRRLEIRYGSSGEENRLKFRFMKDGAEVGAATTATVALFNSSGTTLQAATAMTAEADPSSIFYWDIVATSATQYPLGEGYQAKVVVTYSGETFNDRRLFDVVRQPLHIRISDDDLVSYESDLGEYYAPGETDWSRKIQTACDNVHRAVRQKSNGPEGQGRPGLIIDSEQVAAWAALWAIEMIYRDTEGKEDKADTYKELRAMEQEAVLGSLSYSSSDDIDPGAPDVEYFGGVTLTR